MKILVYGINYSPEKIGIGKYTGEMVEWLSQVGHDVRVICAPPYYPDWRVYKPFKVNRYVTEQDNNVSVTRCPLYVPRNVSTLKRITHLLSFAISSAVPLAKCLKWSPDIVINVVPALFTSPMAIVFSKLYGAKSIIHIQDFEIDAMLGLGMAGEKKTKVNQLIKSIEGSIYKNFDTVSSISNSMLENAVIKGVSSSKTLLLPNWRTPFKIPSAEEVASFRQKLGFSKDESLVLYSGNIGEKQGLEILIGVAKRFENINRNVRFLIAGKGATKRRLLDATKDSDVSSIIISDLLPFEDLPKLLCGTDVHLVIQRAGAADAVLPSKLTNILAVGGNTVITAEKATELGNLCEKHSGIAVCVEPEDEEALFEGIKEALTMPKINETAISYAEEFLDFNQIMASFEEHLTELAGDTLGVQV